MALMSFYRAPYKRDGRGRKKQLDNGRTDAEPAAVRTLITPISL